MIKVILLMVLLISNFKIVAQKWYDDLCHPDFGGACYSVECLKNNMATISCLFLENLNQPELPEKMNQCVELRKIQISECGYGEIPHQVFDCPNLIYLNYCSDSLAILTKEIVRCTKLISLNLCCSHYTHLPRYIKNLKNLEFVVICGNRFKKIPKVLYQMPKLNYLDISLNPIPEKELEKFRKRRPDVELIFEPIPDLKKIKSD